MVLTIVLEALLLAMMYPVAYSFWQFVKRDRFVCHAMNNQLLLDSLILKDLMTHPPSGVRQYAERMSVNWRVNIETLLKSDRSTQRRMKSIYAAGALFIIAGGCLSGLILFIMNSICFLLLALVPLADPARQHAVEHIQCVGLVLYKWRCENPMEFRQWIGRTYLLKKIGAAVERINGK